MKSNVCKIENGVRDLDAILKESERVAEYNGLSHKQALQLRLLCEENGAKLMVVISPNLTAHALAEPGFLEYNESTMKFCRENGINVILAHAPSHYHSDFPRMFSLFITTG